jgi:hypothetical protein
VREASRKVARQDGRGIACADSDGAACDAPKSNRSGPVTFEMRRDITRIAGEDRPSRHRHVKKPALRTRAGFSPMA